MELIFDASFRGVPFQVRLATDQHGRDVVVHRFVKRDNPFAEDMGRASREIEINGFVSGESWRAQRDALVAAFEEEGPGVLVHPWYGELTVSLAAPVKISYQGGVSGEIPFAASFVEVDPGVSHPNVSPHYKGLAGNQAAGCLSLASEGLDQAFSLAGKTSAVVENVISAVRDIAGVVKDVQRGDLLGVTKWVSAALSLDASGIASLLNQGQGLSSLLSPLFSSWQESGKGQELAVSKAMLSVASQTPAVAVPSSPGSVRRDVWQAEQALANYQREAATIEALHAASLAIPSTRREESDLRENLFSAVDSCLLNTANDQLAGELLDLRALSLASLAENGSAAPDVVSVKEASTTPSLVFAYKQVVRESASAPDLLSAENDLLARNGVSHPGFVPGGELMEVLRNGR